MKLLTTPRCLNAGIAIASASAFAGQDDQQNLIIRYNYAMNLDAADVVIIDEPNPVQCAVVETRMTYRTTKVDLRRISYQMLAQACSLQN